MSSPINKKTLEYLAALARLELNPKEEEKLLKDLEAIFGHFEELRTLDTEHVEPMTGGTTLMNAFRNSEQENTNRGAGVDQFPKITENGFLEVPRVFEE